MTVHQPHGLEDYPPLRQSAFTNFFAKAAFLISWVFIAPAYSCADVLISLFRVIPPEIISFRFARIFLAILGVTVTAPLVLIGLPIYILSHLGRRAFTYRIYAERIRRAPNKQEWTIVSCNMKLLPDALARKQYLRNTVERAKQMAIYIAASNTNVALRTISNDVVTSTFPFCDFVCMQEVYDQRAVDRIHFHLRQYFPFIIEDSGVLHYRHGRIVTGSGLMILSKYPLMDADFQQFPGAGGTEGCFCRGVLMAKVHLFKKIHPEERRTVGYIFVTQLHSTDVNIRTEQLVHLDRVSHHFREKTIQKHEIVGFQAIAGDLQFDNVSDCFRTNWSHDLLTRYEDPFRVEAGRDEPYSLTTRLNEKALIQPAMKLSLNIKAVLLNPEQRLAFVKLIEDSESKQAWAPGTNRTQYVLLQHAVGLQLPSRITHACFITAFNNLTTCLPVAVSFTLGDRENDNRSVSTGRMTREGNWRLEPLDDGDRQLALSGAGRSSVGFGLSRFNSEPRDLQRIGAIVGNNDVFHDDHGLQQLGTAQIGMKSGQAIHMQEFDLDKSSDESSTSESDDEETDVTFVDMSDI